ncbi:MAG: hypothetical protein QM811_24285 [Pirellulales bacterium]
MPPTLGPCFCASFGGQPAYVQLGAVQLMRTQATRHRGRRPETFFVGLHVARQHVQFVVGAGLTGRSADANLPDHLPADQAADLQPRQVDRRIELQDRPFGRLDQDQPFLRIGEIDLAGRQKEDRAFRQFHATVGQRVVLVDEELGPFVFENDRVLSFPRVGGEIELIRFQIFADGPHIVTCDAQVGLIAGNRGRVDPRRNGQPVQRETRAQDGQRQQRVANAVRQMRGWELGTGG